MELYSGKHLKVTYKNGRDSIDGYEILGFENGEWVPLYFGGDSEDGEFVNAEAKQLDIQKEHEATVPHRICWYWQSSFSPERRQEIDRFYNSLSAEQRKMMDDIASDARDDERFENYSGGEY